MIVPSNSEVGSDGKGSVGARDAAAGSRAIVEAGRSSGSGRG